MRGGCWADIIDDDDVVLLLFFGYGACEGVGVFGSFFEGVIVTICYCYCLCKFILMF